MSTVEWSELTHDEKWGIVSEKLGKHGVAVDNITFTLAQATLIGQLEADEMIEENDEAWEQWVEGLLEERPLWATIGYKRVQNGRALIKDAYIESWQEVPDDIEFAENKWLAVIKSSNVTEFRTANTLVEVARIVIGTYLTDAEDVEWIEGIYDLETGDIDPDLGYVTTFEVKFSKPEELSVSRTDGEVGIRVNGNLFVDEGVNVS